MARYVILRHETPPGFPRGPHWDLMLERGGVLATWALPEPPDGTEPQIVEALGDHRLAYLDYEGPISDDRGTVAQWDRGSYEIESEEAVVLVVRFEGDKLRGRARLEPLANRTGVYRFTFSPA